ncbi:capsular polysaccharide biosynthesis protein [Kushneria pakistanensis]|uniref:Capsular polysaccharide biosynthesis protein n=1 Tax=Kushneria pakistanensis TaxID=1508770 RepID=A0ABQ3FN55_9GAMM|nr:oligosaccharide biosynthesis protein Alg14 [Kushneria pakistanensis]GHC29841.1 capsular polysaccharide biosynthesis protein [Kushneria pakistanensis]
MKVAFVSSYGGHWVQLKILADLIEADQKIFISTLDNSTDQPSLKLVDFNFGSVHKSLPNFSRIFSFLRKEKPDVIVTTGAAPGLQVLCLARMQGIKTIWVDSIANSQKISLSGRVAKYISTETLTQWERLSAEDKKVKYVGSVL